MHGKTSEHNVTRKQYLHGLTVSFPRLVSNYREREKGYLTVERSDRHVLNQITKVVIIENETTDNTAP